MEDRRESMLQDFQNFFKDHYSIDIDRKSKIGDVIPLRKRFELYSKLESTLRWHLPNLKFSTLNILVRALVISIPILVSFSVTDWSIFYTNIDTVVIGIPGILFVLWGSIHVFLPFLIKKSGFGKIKTVEDFIKHCEPYFES